MKTPRPHQRRAIRAVLKTLRQEPRAQCIMACGTGKTFVGLRIHENLKSNLTVVFVPTLQLVAQLKREWEADRRSPFASLVVCSDVTVVDGASIKAEELGLKPTTNSEKIAEFMGLRGPKVIFCTYQSSPRIAEAQRILSVSIDLVVCDEAHRTTGVDEKGHFQVALDDDLIRAWKRLFMTATPKMASERVRERAAKEGVELVGMDDEKVYGPVAFRYSFSEAIRDRVLCDYRIVFVAVESDEVTQAIDDHTFLTHEHKEMLVEDVAKHVGLGKAIKKYGLERVLAFVNRVRTASDYGSRHTARGFIPTMGATKVLPSRRLWTDHVDGSMSIAQRQLRLDVLGNPQQRIIRVLYNARCLTEGIDTPAMEAVVFLDYRKSIIDAGQIVGRPIRLPPGWVSTDESPEPPLAYVIVPLLYDSGTSEQAFRKSEACARMIEVLQAIQAHDERLEAWIEDIVKNPSRSVVGPESPIEILGHASLELKDVVKSVVLRSSSQKERPLLTKELILNWAREWVKLFGRRPSTHTRTNMSAVCGYDQQWKHINSALRKGARGLPGGDSLSRLLDANGFVPFYGPTYSWTEDDVVEWMQRWYREYGNWSPPGDVSAEDYCGCPVTWNQIRSALQAGKHGLPGGNSLHVLLVERGLQRDDYWNSIETRLRRLVREHCRRVGKWPNRSSGQIDEQMVRDAMLPPLKEKTWRELDDALQQGWRGLPEGLTLDKVASCLEKPRRAARHRGKRRTA